MVPIMSNCACCEKCGVTVQRTEELAAAHEEARHGYRDHARIRTDVRIFCLLWHFCAFFERLSNTVDNCRYVCKLCQRYSLVSKRQFLNFHTQVAH